MVLEIRVSPKSSRSVLEKVNEKKYKAYLRSAPVNNKANDELVGLLAQEFGVKKYQIDITSGLTSRNKLVNIDFDS